MALATGVSPRLRPPGPRGAGRHGRSRGFSSGCARPDRNKEAAEAQAGVAPCGPEEGNGSMVNGEGSGEGGRAWRAGPTLRWWPRPPFAGGLQPCCFKAQCSTDPNGP